jgi:hypothetical protein
MTWGTPLPPQVFCSFELIHSAGFTHCSFEVIHYKYFSYNRFTIKNLLVINDLHGNG